MKKKSPCASVKARLSNLNILKKYIIREKFGVGVTGGRWRERGKGEIKQLARFFCLHRAGGSQDPMTSRHGDSSSSPLLRPLALQ